MHGDGAAVPLQHRRRVQVRHDAPAPGGLQRIPGPRRANRSMSATCRLIPWSCIAPEPRTTTLPERRAVQDLSSSMRSSPSTSYEVSRLLPSSASAGSTSSQSRIPAFQSSSIRTRFERHAEVRSRRTRSSAPHAWPSITSRHTRSTARRAGRHRGPPASRAAASARSRPSGSPAASHQPRSPGNSLVVASLGAGWAGYSWIEVRD
jgi:hypothetical protein